MAAGMRCSLLVLFLCLLIAVSCSPIHGIWNNLPMARPGKRMYGLYQHLPALAESDLDKRNVFFWRPFEVLVD